MAEYIDKDKFCHYLFKHIATFAENMIQMPVASTLQSVVNEIHEFQSEDVQPVKHGRWVFNKPPDDWIMSLYTCDQCGHLEEGKPNYCPNCGAKMYGEDNG